jgi:hypothetical protein
MPCFIFLQGVLVSSEDVLDNILQVRLLLYACDAAGWGPQDEAGQCAVELGAFWKTRA